MFSEIKWGRELSVPHGGMQQAKDQGYYWKAWENEHTCTEHLACDRACVWHFTSNEDGG